jgi:hypothetical protein
MTKKSDNQNEGQWVAALEELCEAFDSYSEHLGESFYKYLKKKKGAEWVGPFDKFGALADDSLKKDEYERLSREYLLKDPLADKKMNIMNNFESVVLGYDDRIDKIIDSKNETAARQMMLAFRDFYKNNKKDIDILRKRRSGHGDSKFWAAVDRVLEALGWSRLFVHGTKFVGQLGKFAKQVDKTENPAATHQVHTWFPRDKKKSN